MTNEPTTDPERERDATAGEQPDAAAAAAEPDATDEASADEAAPDAPDELASLQEELDALNDRHLRLAAEFDNYRKRVGRERDEMRTRAQADLAGRLLDVLDDLQRFAGYDEDETSAEALLEGVQLVEKKFRHVLESMGLEPIQAEGEFFNPSTMEALMTVPAERPEEDEAVADVFQKGYRFGEQLIRPARVRVKKYDAADAEQ